MNTWARRKYSQADFPASKSPSLRQFSDHPIERIEKKVFYSLPDTKKMQFFNISRNIFEKNSRNVKKFVIFAQNLNFLSFFFKISLSLSPSCPMKLSPFLKPYFYPLPCQFLFPPLPTIFSVPTCGWIPQELPQLPLLNVDQDDPNISLTPTLSSPGKNKFFSEKSQEF